MQKKAILGYFILLFFGVNSQELPKELEPVVIEGKEKSIKESSNQELQRKEINLFQPEDIGVVLQRFAGVSMKNYGGLGGLKTFSIRGIGGSHSVIIVDGFSIQNTQAGQVDLSTVQTDNVESISLIQSGKSDVLHPVSAYLAGNSLLIKTFENQFSKEVFQLRSSLKSGSFGQFDSYFAMKWSKEKFYTSVFVKYRKANGRYPFEIENGLHSYEGIRENNELNEVYSGFSAGCRLSNKSLLKFSYSNTFIDKGIPGAVILYNPTANQYLENRLHQVNVDYKLVNKKFISRIYLSARYDELFYTDSSFLNTEGFLFQAFYQTNLQNGYVFKQQIRENKTYFLYGIEQQVAFLKSSNFQYSKPKRYHLKTFFAVEHVLKNSEILAQIGVEGLQNEVDHEYNREKALTPSFLWRRQKPSKFVGLPLIWLKRSFRMPTFNEMYFNQVGNVHLKPEIANQFNIGTVFSKVLNKTELNMQGNVYYNLVENKIVAIPTKNVFIWSMQNVGLVQIIGADVQFSTFHSFENLLQMKVNASYSFQDATDRTSRTTFTYKHQIPYIPKHTVQSDLSFVYKRLGISISTLFTSSRYALNENIASNEIPAFYTVDFSTFYKIYLKNKHVLTLQASLKNITNQSYAYVRYFVMPGRNYILSLNYELK